MGGANNEWAGHNEWAEKRWSAIIIIIKATFKLTNVHEKTKTSISEH